MSNPNDDTGVPSGLNDDAEMERTQPRAPLMGFSGSRLYPDYKKRGGTCLGARD